MYLSKLELSGFKSFAKKTTLSFPKLELGKSNITAIVGPNGSGKSNIADAIRWVTGEQSVKNLRGKKSEDIIFSGTDKSARLGAAEVSLYLDNSDHKAPIDYSELVITRKLYRNGDSEYLINGSKSRLQDILLLMAQLSFGQKSYSIIGQGMADAILSATPYDRKNFLNEAAGIKQYQIKRDQANNKLENTKNNLKQAEILTAEIEPRLRSLTRQVKKLERREEIEKKLDALQIKFYSYRWSLVKNQWENLSAKIKKITNEKQKIQEEFNSLQSQLENLAIEKKESDSFEKLQSQYSRLQETKNQLLHQKTILSAKIEVLSITAAAEPKNEPIKTYSLTDDEINDLLATLNKTKDMQENIIKESKNKNFENVNILAEKILKQINSLIQEIKKDDTSPDGTSPEARRAQGEALAKRKEDQSKEQTKNIRQQIEKIEKETNLQNTELQKISEKINSLSQEHNKERQELFHLQKQIQLKQNELNNFISQENNLKVELARTETHKEDLETEIKQELGSTEKLSKKTSDENTTETHSQIQSLKHQLELIGGIDPEIAKEYEETQERFKHLDNQINDLKQACESMEKLAKKLDDIIKTRFDSSFEKINSKFQKFFKILFDGGSAKLTYTKEIIAAPIEASEQNEINQKNPDTSDDTSPTSNIKHLEDPEQGRREASSIKEGVEIEATPPGKRLKSINMLSGGERALTSIALICAIIASNPSPFVVLDEVDAALDEANSVRLAKILENLSHKTQFVVITHNRATMEKAKILYGVTMSDNGISKLLSIKLEEVK